MKHPRRPAFTLLEMVCSLFITTILVVAIGSALRFGLTVAGSASATGGTGATIAEAQTLAADVADQIVADLNTALDFSEKTATAVTFTVPDRDGDGNPEKLRYAWYGAAGNAAATPPVPAYTLTREYNSGAWVAMASNVRACNFTLLYRNVTVPAAAPAEQLLFSYDPAGSSTSTFFDTNNAGATGFKANVPSGTSTFTITRLRLNFVANNVYDGILWVQLRYADSSKQPYWWWIDYALVPEVAASDTGSWVDIPLTSAGGLSTAYNYAVVVIGYTGTSSSGGVNYASGIPSSTKSWTSNNGAWNWSSLGGRCMRMYVYGTVP